MELNDILEYIDSIRNKEDLITIKQKINEKNLSIYDSYNKNIKIRITSPDEVINYIMKYATSIFNYDVVGDSNRWVYYKYYETTQSNTNSANHERAYNLENRETYAINGIGWDFYAPLLLGVDKTYSDDVLILHQRYNIYSYGAVFRPVFVFDD